MLLQVDLLQLQLINFLQIRNFYKKLSSESDALCPRDHIADLELETLL